MKKDSWRQVKSANEVKSYLAIFFAFVFWGALFFCIDILIFSFFLASKHSYPTPYFVYLKQSVISGAWYQSYDYLLDWRLFYSLEQAFYALTKGDFIPYFFVSFVGGYFLWLLYSASCYRQIIMSGHGAVNVTTSSGNAEYKAILSTLTETATQVGLAKVPGLYIYESEGVNAYSGQLGSGAGFIAISSAAVNTLSPGEVKTILASELYKIKRKDTSLLVSIMVLARPILMFKHILGHGLSRKKRGLFITFVRICFYFVMMAAVGLSLLLYLNWEASKLSLIVMALLLALPAKIFLLDVVTYALLLLARVDRFAYSDGEASYIYGAVAPIEVVPRVAHLVEANSTYDFIRYPLYYVPPLYYVKADSYLYAYLLSRAPKIRV